MLLTTPSEMKMALRSEPKVSVHFHGTCEEAMLLHHPFSELADHRALRGMQTEIRITTKQPQGMDIQGLFLDHSAIAADPIDVVVSIQCDQSQPCVADFRNKLDIGSKMKKRMQPILPCFSTDATGSLYLARRRSPYKPYVSDDFPPRITILPPPAHQNFLSSHIDSFLTKKMMMELVQSLNQNGYQVLLPRALKNGMWNTSIAWSIESETNIFECNNARDLGIAILSSSIVVAFHSEYSLLSSMLSVPTLTIYGPDVSFKRFALADFALPQYSVMVDQVHKANGSTILSRIREIQSQLLHVC